MKERFLEWGAGLSAEDFACALAAFGVLGGRKTLSRAKGAFNWRFDPRLFEASAADLANAWRTFRESYSGAVAIRLDRKILLLQGIDPLWLQSWLAHVPGSTLVLLTDDTRFIAVGVPETVSRGLGSESYSASEEEPEAPPPAPPPPTRRRAAVKSQPENRRLYAQLISLFYPVRQQLVSGALRPGKAYSARIGVGLPNPDRKDVGKPIPDLGDDAKGHDLTVIWEPRAGSGPEVQTLHLPPTGDSGTVEFRFLAPADRDSFEARVMVLHANRVLQTGLLKAPIGKGEDWTFQLDAAPRTRLEGLSARREFDVALVLDHDDEGTARGTAISGDQAVPILLKESSVDSLTQALGDQISKIAANPKRYESLRSEGTEELLRNLAQHGGGLYQQLSGYHPLAKLDEVDAEGRQARLHVTSARPDSFFPVELVYRYEVPDDSARLCEHALTALAEGSCPASCPSDKSLTVCPLGFWGLCRVIERHSYLVQPDKPAEGFQLRAEPVLQRSLLDISGKALLAASDVASKYENGAVGGLLQKLRERGPAELASSWQEWSERVKADRPTLLVLLPHHERRDGFEILEIGTADALKSVLVKKKHVRVEDKDRPIVLLMGCGTNLARIAFENFVGSFILQGAAIVVSTIATILGRHASPATAHLIELLDEEAGEEGSTFGEVMVRLRRKLLATETPMALGLTAYGDADWILTRKTDADDRDAPRPLR